MSIAPVSFALETETMRCKCDICEEAITGERVRRPYKPEENGGLKFDERMRDVRNVLVKTLMGQGWHIISRHNKDELCICPRCMKHTILEYVRNNFAEKKEV